MAKIFWLDVETTGTHPWKNDIIQLAYIVEKVKTSSARVKY